ncbi:hypothetical protein [Croceibacterium aestuarii]|uniref:hypothetical protein n=1 Tax=Croceibacterium aestuarii TaxID=3064139 RepID=UPI00272EB058|nr:hypothetical protein [Croceibacterium sp. D39]
MRKTEADKAALDHLKPVEPDFASQNGEKMDEAERHKWFAEVGEEMRQRGASHVRYSFDPDLSIALVEGWRVVPANEPPPRYFLKAD